MLVPLDSNPSPTSALRLTSAFAELFNPSCKISFLHVGDSAQRFDEVVAPIEYRKGPVEETIMSFANEIGADLIAMPRLAALACSRRSGGARPSALFVLPTSPSWRFQRKAIYPERVHSG